jgi:hypothetical protein
VTTRTDSSPAPDPAPTPAAERRSWLRDHSELGVCVLLLALGALVLTDALTMDVDITQRGPVGPKTVPIVVGIGLLVIAALLAVDVLRGGRGEAEGGEDSCSPGSSSARRCSSSRPASPSPGHCSSGVPRSRWAAAVRTAIR